MIENIPATSLGEGWYWHKYNDGSGCLIDPLGYKRLHYDLYTREFEMNETWYRFDDSEESPFTLMELAISKHMPELWREVESKTVPDFDGFSTDYTLYENMNVEGEPKYVCVFGDKDMYHPEDHDYDWYSDKDFDAAKEWFDNYKGFEEEFDVEPLVETSASEPGKRSPWYNVYYYDTPGGQIPNLLFDKGEVFEVIKTPGIGAYVALKRPLSEDEMQSYEMPEASFDEVYVYLPEFDKLQIMLSDRNIPFENTRRELRVNTEINGERLAFTVITDGLGREDNLLEVCGSILTPKDIEEYGNSIGWQNAAQVVSRVQDAISRESKRISIHDRLADAEPRADEHNAALDDYYEPDLETGFNPYLGDYDYDC